MQYEHCAFQECTIYFNRPFINLTLDLGYFDLEIVVHLDRLTPKSKVYIPTQ